jgi:hypothetical protein
MIGALQILHQALNKRLDPMHDRQRSRGSQARLTADVSCEDHRLRRHGRAGHARCGRARSGPAWFGVALIRVDYGPAASAAGLSRDKTLRTDAPLKRKNRR